MMKQDIEIIKEEARDMGACKLVDSITSWKTLANTIMSPQGIEFIEKHDKNRILCLFRAYKGRVQTFGMYVDSCRTVRAKGYCGAFIGKMRAIADCKGTDATFTYMVMDGATLVLNAGNYAVIRVYNLGGTIEVNNDGTAKILE